MGQNTAPRLGPLGPMRTLPNIALAFTAIASDNDFPAQTLTFTLAPGAPAGAAIEADGDFSWTPPVSAIGTTSTIEVIVTDDGVPPLSVTGTFTVAVGALPDIKSGDILVASYDADAVVRIDPATGTQQSLGEFDLPMDVAMGPDGMLYVGEALGTIKRVDLTTLAVTAVNPHRTLRDLASLTIGPTGDIYAVSASSNAVIRIDPATGTERVLAKDGNLIGPTGVDLLDATHLVVACFYGQELVSVSLSDGAQSVIATGLPFPCAVAAMTTGVYVACADMQALKRVTAGIASDVYSTPNYVGAGVAVDVNSNAVVTLNGDDSQVVCVSPAGALIRSYAGALIMTPNGVAVVARGAPQKPQVLAIAVLPCNRISCNWSAETGVSYRLQWISDLTCANWIDIGATVVASNVTCTAVTDGGGGSNGFYRVRTADSP